MSMPPSAAPVVLLNDLIRPLTMTMNWLGPTAPLVSGGINGESALVAPRSWVPTVWAARGDRVPDAGCGSGVAVSLREAGFGRRFPRLAGSLGGRAVGV